MVKIKLVFSFLFFLSLTCFSQVGIGTNTPGATLDVNGNLKIRTVSGVSGISDNIDRLAIDTETKEVKVVRTETSTGSAFSMNYLVYYLNNTNEDWVRNFNTKISAADYTVVVVGSAFDQNLMANDDTDYNPINVYAFKEGGTWRISADYLSGRTHVVTGGQWKIYCLAINNRVLKTIPSVTVNMKGTENGSAPNPPAGL
ncbi:hypothetical protein [Flavobacterium sp. CAU 1735]|uniref:hypothetical protein n=1 Tax=Flavobacterium sp. CAU 1735 TaxID=3140361 RepID=UPI00325FEBF4